MITVITPQHNQIVKRLIESVSNIKIFWDEDRALCRCPTASIPELIKVALQIAGYKVKACSCVDKHLKNQLSIMIWSSDITMIYYILRGLDN